jgi:MoaA/NifB/PqqE/SkfB family radical SAM enzyme
MDDKNNNKQFRVYDITRKYIRLSVDETIARGLNKWQNWECSGGARGLYIDYDGNVWVCNTASAKLNRFNYVSWRKYAEEWKLKHWQPYVENGEYNEKIIPPEWQAGGPQWLKMNVEHSREPNVYTKILPTTEQAKKENPGFIGNINDTLQFTKNWFVCPWESCGCGADVVLSKAKTKAARTILSVTNKGWPGKEATLKDQVDDIGSPIGVETHFPVPYQVLWDLGRKCNYDCHYCWPAVHNKVDPHKDYDLLIRTFDHIIDNWAGGESIRWNFGGGEPTLHPRFIDLMKHLKSRNQWTLVTSNGTRDYKYWGELIQNLNTVLMSAHFDGLISEKEEDRFVRNIQTICEHFNNHDDDHWIEVKLMTPPKYIERSLNLKKKILDLNLIQNVGANGRINGVISMVPIRKDSSSLVEYTDEQIQLMQTQ